MANDYLDELFGLAGQVAVVIGGTGVLGGALCRGLGPGRGHGGRRRPQRRARRGARRERSKKLGGTGVVRCRSMSSASDRSKRCWPRRSRSTAASTCWSTAPASMRPAPYLEVTDDDWDRVLDINLHGTASGLPDFRPAHGRQPAAGAILNIGSVTADLPLSRVFAYSASKAAVVNLTQNVAREFAPHGVRVNALCPGFFPAEQNRKILDAERTANDHAANADGPLRRAGRTGRRGAAAAVAHRPAASSPARRTTSTAASRRMRF